MRIAPTYPLRVWLTVFGTASCLSLAACTANGTPDDTPPQTGSAADQAAMTDIEPSGPFFINLLPWGEVDFSRGEFASLGECNAFVRALPNYSGYTTPERCQPIDDPVYCTVWQSNEAETAQIACVKGVGGCEIELKRHDLLAESGTRVISERCQPYPLADAWERYQASAPADTGATAPTGTP